MTLRIHTVEALLLLSHPDDEFIHATVDAQREAALTYSQIGGTRHSLCPDGFASNQWDAVIGNGEDAFQRAKVAVRNFQMLRLGWIQHVGPVEPIADDSIVCTLARQFMVYSLNVAKIVYVDNDTSSRFGFAYGTTCEYPITGEEHFTVSINETTGDVTYQIRSFSRPNSFIMRLALPWLRRAQRRFCRESTAAMRTACQYEIQRKKRAKHAVNGSGRQRES